MLLNTYLQSIALVFLTIVALLLVSGCTSPESITPRESTALGDTPDWFSIPLIDLQTGEEIQIDSLVALGKPIIIHTFTTSCPACTAQFKESTDLQINSPGNYTVLALNIDAMEGDATIRRYIERNEYQGHFVTPPRRFSRGLIETFGIRVMQSTPQTIIICNGEIYFLGSGVYSSEGLAWVIGDLCP